MLDLQRLQDFMPNLAAFNGRYYLIERQPFHKIKDLSSAVCWLGRYKLEFVLSVEELDTFWKSCWTSIFM
jgi:hypothetical protein